MSGKKNKNTSFSGDFSLSEFADSKFKSAGHSFRPKKSFGNTTAKMQTEADWSWDNGDDDDDDLDLVEQENEDGTKSIVIARSSKKSAKQEDKYIDIEQSEGMEYPVAVWFLISEYVKPEDVGRFAGICKGSLYVTTYAKFWHDLHKKYCKPTSILPKRLQSESLKRRYGLRALVIRSLYYTYPLYISITMQPLQQFSTPQGLMKRKCTCMWYQRYKDQWVFFFKMKLTDNPLYRSNRKSIPKKDWLTILDDIQANPEDDCKVLKVICGSFSDAPLTMGMTLRLLQTSLAPNMRSQRLTLGFSAGYQEKPECLIVLDTVVKVQVLDWWHPLYPHSGEYIPAATMSQNISLNTMFDLKLLLEDCY